MTSSEISQRRYELERERRAKVRELMNEYDETYYRPRMKQLRAECKATGHNMRFHDTNATGDPLFICTICGFIEVGS